MEENRIEDLFKAYSGSLDETMTCHANAAGFKVPEYQRDYNWNHKNIKRLLEDCLTRFADFCQSTKSSQRTETYSFLGTIILVRVINPSDEGFDGTSLVVIDGQQRLTTLSLICSALIEAIQSHREDLDAAPKEVKNWINSEVDHQLETLFTCVSGRLTRRRVSTYYPRIIRQGDRRDYNRDAEYISPVAKFLHAFAVYYDNDEKSFNPSWKNSEADQSLRNNYQYIQKQVGYLYEGDHGTSTNDVECQFVPRSNFAKASTLALFDMLAQHFPDDESGQKVNKAIGKLSSGQYEGFIRLILFASYLVKNVVLTRVETSNENYAFDIFDALNTTGELLTALEAFKPQVVKFENGNQGKYSGSDSKEYFTELEKYFSGARNRQKTVKEILASFALYHDGYKLPLDLSNQRKYLRDSFEALGPSEKKKKFVETIYHVADYQRNCWETDGISKSPVRPGTNPDELEPVKFCLAFIASTGTRLSIPILARYWNDRDNFGQQDFMGATKALATFLALRRSATGGTKNIDADFRKLMKESPKVGGDPLCLGKKHSHQLINVGEFKKELQHYLASLGITDEETWVRLASTKPLASSSSPLCRFLIFTAAHRSSVDRASHGTLTRENGRSSKDYIRHSAWLDERYKTIEHVAPDNPSNGPDDWNSVYTQPETRHLVGNIVLLPSDINSSLGNSTWEKKIACYKALASETKKDFGNIVDAAVKQGNIERKAAEKLKKTHENSPQLDMLDPIISVKKWDKELIERRTDNILRLAWGAISPWLYN